MRAGGLWVRAPKGSIPQGVKDVLRARLNKHAQTKWRERCREMVVRFRSAFAYVDAFPRYRQPVSGTTPEERARIEATPIHLCRLGYLGGVNRLAYAFFKYSDERYAPSVVA